jgi:hypothetical protein
MGEVYPYFNSIQGKPVRKRLSMSNMLIASLYLSSPQAEGKTSIPIGARHSSTGFYPSFPHNSFA